MSLSKPKIIAGVDEAGRGPLAGPVCASAVILPENHNIEGLADSKKLSAKKREVLAIDIKEKVLGFAIFFVEPCEIDRINILRASLKAMRQAVLKLPITPDLVQIDGNVCPELPGLAVEAVVKGDSKIEAISAASILAKVARDHKMLEIDAKYPEYGFAQHKGYGTKRHIAALEKYGSTPAHRTSFAPVKRLCLRGVVN